MAFTYNGVAPANVTYNGATVEVITYNGAEVWRRWTTTTYTVTANRLGFKVSDIVTLAEHANSDEVHIIINAGVSVASNGNGPSEAAITVDDTHGKKVVIINRGTISGMGGDGGRAGEYTYSGSPHAAQAGDRGGPAIIASQAVTIENHGTIQAGGGGGGGGGAIWEASTQRPEDGGGGGGAQGGNSISSSSEGGSSHGRGGHASDAPSGEATSGSSKGQRGDYAGWGKGGSGTLAVDNHNAYSGSGGRGGNYGESGKRGLPSVNGGNSANRTMSGANGGPSGYSIRGLSHVTLSVRGTIKGPTEN